MSSNKCEYQTILLLANSLRSTFCKLYAHVANKSFPSLLKFLTLVRVPVLSNAMVSSCARRSKTSPPRRRSPRLAPMEDATRTAVGVASPSAQGQATTSTLMASLRPRRVLPATPAASIALGNRPPPANIYQGYVIIHCCKEKWLSSDSMAQ